LLAGAVLATAAPAGAHPDHSGAPRGTLSDSGTRRSVEVKNLRFAPGGSLDGTLVNRSGDVLRQIRLLIRYDWIWDNERNPGDNSPARSFYHTLPSELPALGTLGFSFTPSPPLPVRSDGKFVASVEIARFTQVKYRVVPGK